MSLVFNMVGGGGAAGGAELPAIYAVYPAGSVCTCTNGSKTFTAKDTTGFWLFAGLDVGTWTVAITDGTRTRSKTVEITAEGQIESVELNYRLYLYNAGDECTDVTGGWASKALGLNSSVPGANDVTVTRGTSSITATQTSGSKCGILYAANKIDLTEYTELHAICVRNAAAQYQQVALNIWSSIGSYVNTNRSASADIPTTLEDLVVDISSLSGMHNIGFSVYNGGNYVTLQEMWLK